MTKCYMIFNDKRLFSIDYELPLPEVITVPRLGELTAEILLTQVVDAMISILECGGVSAYEPPLCPLVYQKFTIKEISADNTMARYEEVLDG